MKLLRLLILFIFIFSACSTPKQVKELSSKTLQVNKAYLETVRQCFSYSESLMDLLIKKKRNELEDLGKQSVQKHMKLALLEYQSERDSIAKVKVLDVYAEKIKKATQNNMLLLEELEQKRVHLKKMHKDCLAAHQKILEAEAKLNQYLLLEKADQLVVNKLLGVIGVEKEKVASMFDQATKLNSTLEKINL